MYDCYKQDFFIDTLFSILLTYLYMITGMISFSSRVTECRGFLSKIYKCDSFSCVLGRQEPMTSDRYASLMV